MFDAHKQVFKDRIEEAYDAVCLTALKDDILGFSHLSVGDMLNHLELQCLSLIDREKAKQLREMKIEWDKPEEELKDDYGIIWTTDLKIIAAVDTVYKIGLFTWEYNGG